MSVPRIVVPIDFSENSLNALAYARDLAKRLAAELLLLHVVEPVYIAEPYVSASPAVAEFLNEQWRNAKAELSRIGAELEKQGYQVRTSVKGGSPAQTIVETARRTGAHLIVMGTHGRTGLAHMFIGSIAEKVVRTARCPVLTVRGAAGKWGAATAAAGKPA